jgi:ACS family hexuronate transporter-like MFS transporter
VTETSNSAWKWWICGLLLLATTLNYMDRMALNQTAYRIQQYFQMNNETYGLLEGRFSLAFAIGALVVGFVVDRANVRWIYPLMVVGWSLCGFLTGFVESISALFLCRFLLGLFEAGNWPCGVLTVRRVLKPEERSLGNAMFQSGTALGAIVTPLIVLGCLRLSDPQSDFRAGVQLVVGGVAEEVLPTPASAWQLPFRVIGAVGVLWALLWLLTVRSRHVAPPPEVPGQTSDTESFGAILKDRRYWLLLVMVLAVNTTWHSFRVWMPNYLRLEQGYSESAMQAFSSLYYLAADVGSITVGVVTLWLARRKMTLFSSRMWAFSACALLTLLSFATRFESGWTLRICLLVVAFGALGLFPLYFAFSQEISSRHQGKITGSLGCLNALYLWQLFPLQGRIVDQTKSYSLGLSVAGVVPLVAMVAFLLFWPRNRDGTVNASGP